MNIDLSYFFPRKLFSAETINGNLSVYKEGGRRRVVVGGVTQSLSDTNLINKKGYWQGYLTIPTTPQRALILGYGAGTADALLRERYPTIEVIGVEIDPVIANQARKLLFPDLSSPVFIQTAQEFLAESPQTFDLILCDIFSADKVDPSVFDNEFWVSVKTHVSPNGLVVINRILSQDNPREFSEFEGVLAPHFSIIDVLKINNPTRRYNCLFYAAPK